MTMKRTAIFLGIALAVSAGGPAYAKKSKAASNRGLATAHQPVVSRTDYVYDVATDGGSITASEANRLAGWFNSLKIGYGDKIAVDNADNYANNGATDVVATLAARYGLLIDKSAPLTAGQVAPGSLRVVVSRLKAIVPGCSDWSQPAQPNFGARTSSNYGCATSSNLAAMIANPSDLIEGQIGDPTTSVATSSKAVKTYRDSTNTGSGGLNSEGTGQQ